MDHSKQHYYGSKQVGGFYHGYLFHYDPTGNRHVQVWLSPEQYDTPEAAEDATVLYIEESGIEDRVGTIEMGS